jgi:hypothetical protein
LIFEGKELSFLYVYTGLWEGRNKILSEDYMPKKSMIPKVSKLESNRNDRLYKLPHATKYQPSEKEVLVSRTVSFMMHNQVSVFFMCGGQS